MSETTVNQYAILDANNVVVNRIVWNGQGDIWLFEGQTYVLDNDNEWPIGSTYSGSETPAKASNYYPAPTS